MKKVFLQYLENQSESQQQNVYNFQQSDDIEQDVQNSINEIISDMKEYFQDYIVDQQQIQTINIDEIFQNLPNLKENIILQLNYQINEYIGLVEKKDSQANDKLEKQIENLENQKTSQAKLKFVKNLAMKMKKDQEKDQEQLEKQKELDEKQSPQKEQKSLEPKSSTNIERIMSGFLFKLNSAGNISGKEQKRNSGETSISDLVKFAGKDIDSIQQKKIKELKKKYQMAKNLVIMELDAEDSDQSFSISNNQTLSEHTLSDEQQSEAHELQPVKEQEKIIKKKQIVPKNAQKQYNEQQALLAFIQKNKGKREQQIEATTKQLQQEFEYGQKSQDIYHKKMELKLNIEEKIKEEKQKIIQKNQQVLQQSQLNISQNKQRNGQNTGNYQNIVKKIVPTNKFSQQSKENSFNQNVQNNNLVLEEFPQNLDNNPNNHIKYQFKQKIKNSVFQINQDQKKRKIIGSPKIRLIIASIINTNLLRNFYNYKPKNLLDSEENSEEEEQNQNEIQQQEDLEEQYQLNEEKNQNYIQNLKQKSLNLRRYCLFDPNLKLENMQNKFNQILNESKDSIQGHQREKQRISVFQTLMENFDPKKLVKDMAIKEVQSSSSESDDSEILDQQDKQLQNQVLKVVLGVNIGKNKDEKKEIQQIQDEKQQIQQNDNKSLVKMEPKKSQIQIQKQQQNTSSQLQKNEVQSFRYFTKNVKTTIQPISISNMPTYKPKMKSSSPPANFYKGKQQYQQPNNSNNSTRPGTSNSPPQSSNRQRRLVSPQIKQNQNLPQKSNFFFPQNNSQITHQNKKPINQYDKYKQQNSQDQVYRQSPKLLAVIKALPPILQVNEKYKQVENKTKNLLDYQLQKNNLISINSRQISQKKDGNVIRQSYSRNLINLSQKDNTIIDKVFKYTPINDSKLVYKNNHKLLKLKEELKQNQNNLDLKQQIQYVQNNKIIKIQHFYDEFSHFQIMNALSVLSKKQPYLQLDFTDTTNQYNKSDQADKYLQLKASEELLKLKNKSIKKKIDTIIIQFLLEEMKFSPENKIFIKQSSELKQKLYAQNRILVSQMRNQLLSDSTDQKLKKSLQNVLTNQEDISIEELFNIKFILKNNFQEELQNLNPEKQLYQLLSTQTLKHTQQKGIQNQDYSFDQDDCNDINPYHENFNILSLPMFINQLYDNQFLRKKPPIQVDNQGNKFQDSIYNESVNYENFQEQLNQKIDIFAESENDLQHKKLVQQQIFRYKYQENIPFSFQRALDQKELDMETLLMYKNLIEQIEFWHKIKASNIVVRAVRKELKDIHEINREILHRYDPYIDLGLTVQHVYKMIQKLRIQLKDESYLVWVAYLYCIFIIKYSLGEKENEQVGLNRLELLLQDKFVIDYDLYFENLIKFLKIKFQFLQKDINYKIKNQYLRENSWCKFYDPKKDVFYYYNFYDQTQQTEFTEIQEYKQQKMLILEHSNYINMLSGLSCLIQNKEQIKQSELDKQENKILTNINTNQQQNEEEGDDQQYISDSDDLNYYSD